jgi:glycosyltransferase involved in cell wall biosynthesis
VTLDLVLLAIAVLTTLALAAVSIDFAIGHASIRALEDIPPVAGGPSVSLIVSARNEAHGIEAAVDSLLRLDYSPLELIMIDDRSTDETSAILARLARRDSRLKVVTIAELPKGWLGKNHALWIGAGQAGGDRLLFTDADIVFEKTTISRAMRYMESGAIDHLTAIPETRVPGLALNAMVAAFGVFFSLYARPWKARDPRSRSHIGVGAFNLIRADTYRAIGTHQAIAMRPDDDLKLGKLVKKHGFRQDVVNARGFVVVEWYSSLREMIDGLMKNAFAGVDYSLPAVAGSTFALLLMNVWPFVAVFATSGITRALNGVSVLLIAAVFWISARHSGARVGYVFGYPLAAILFAYIIWRSALTAVFTGTITWRGTAYPLSQMRANRI